MRISIKGIAREALAELAREFQRAAEDEPCMHDVILDIVEEKKPLRTVGQSSLWATISPCHEGSCTAPHARIAGGAS